jgi:hypothetical protein
MAAFGWIKSVWEHLNWVFGLGRYCFSDVGRFDECEFFWQEIGIALAIICVVTLTFIGRHVLRAYRAHRRAWAKRQGELVVAPREVMEQAKWQDNSGLDSDLSQEELVQRIKDAKSQLHARNASGPDNTSSGDKALGIDILHR